MMDVVGVKVLSGFLFFFIAFIFGILPFLVFRRCISSKSKGPNANNSILIQCLHSLASGVLIATCLLHLLPESLHNVQDELVKRQNIAAQRMDREKNASELQLTGYSDDVDEDISDRGNSLYLYPVAELMVALGFLVTYFIESTIKSINHDKQADHRVKYSRLKDCDDEEEVEIYVHKPVKASTNNGDSRERNVFSSYEDKTIMTEIDLDAEENSTDSMMLSHNSKHSHDDESKLKKSDHVRCAALLMALCIHGFFDGIMLGLQTSTSTLLSLLLALSLHKAFVATSLSLTLLKSFIHHSKSRLRVLIYILLFASVAPLGIAASAAFVDSRLFASQGNDDVSLVPGCIQAFAVGTFLYVTFSEATGLHGESRSLKIEILCHVFLLFGFIFMALMRIMLSES